MKAGKGGVSLMCSLCDSQQIIVKGTVKIDLLLGKLAKQPQDQDYFSFQHDFCVSHKTHVATPEP